MEGGCITSFAVWKQCDMPVVCDKPTMALRIHNKLPDKVTQRGDGSPALGAQKAVAYLA